MTARSALHSGRTVPDTPNASGGRAPTAAMLSVTGSGEAPSSAGSAVCPSCPTCSLSQARYRSRPFSTS